MADYIIKGKPDVSGLPKISVGKIIYNKLNQVEDKVCMIDGETDEKLTYKELLKKSVRLADALKRLGLKQDDVISQSSANSINFFVPYFAGLYYGFIFNSINPENKKYELCHYLGLTKPTCIFCSKEVLPKMLDIKPDFPFIKFIVVTDAPSGKGFYSMDELIEEEPKNPNFQPLDFDPEDKIALILFSSGTTGLPKAVALSHKNIRAGLMQIGPGYIETSKNDIYLNFLPKFHVACATIIGIFYQETTLVILRGFQPKLFFSTIEKYKCTFTIIVPQILHFFCISPMLDNYDLSSLKVVFCGTAIASSVTTNSFQKRFPSILLFNLYGLTESTGSMLNFPMDKSILDNLGTVSSNMEAKVVDIETRKALGPRNPGELCIKGDFVLKEYYNNKKATAEAFDEEGFFKTGDIVYFDEENRIYIVDRIKDMIKYKGYQVSPVELETVLMLHKAVKDVGVIGVPDQRAGEVPVAFVVQNEQVSEKELLDFVASHLSNYKHLHGGVKFVEEIPRNSMKKLNRNILKEVWRKMQENIKKTE